MISGFESIDLLFNKFVKKGNEMKKILMWVVITMIGVTFVGSNLLYAQDVKAESQKCGKHAEKGFKPDSAQCVQKCKMSCAAEKGVKCDKACLDKCQSQCAEKCSSKHKEAAPEADKPAVPTPKK